MACRPASAIIPSFQEHRSAIIFDTVRSRLSDKLCLLNSLLIERNG